MKINHTYTYYELVNTTSEYGECVSCRSTNLDLLKQEMQHYSDWWCPKGTGRIYKIILQENQQGLLDKGKELIYEK